MPGSARRRRSGPAVLVVHGAGGGYDQGRSIAKAIGGGGLRWIAPSRFGYLRTPLPADASTAAQADAFANLLDDLGIDRVAILAMSGGVPPSYWVLKKVARSRLEAIFDVKPDVRAVLTPEEKAFVTDMVDAFEPVTKRTDGLRNEGAKALRHEAPFCSSWLTAGSEAGLMAVLDDLRAVRSPR